MGVSKSQVCLVPFLFGIASVAMVAPAFAEGRDGAPIRYAGQGAATVANGVSETPPTVSSDRASERIRFIYPSGAGVEAPTALAPTPVASIDRDTDVAVFTAGPAERIEEDVLAPPSTPPSLRHTPVAGPTEDEVGQASWYGEAFDGKPTANGETFDMTELSAAHPSFPLPSLVKVTNLANNKEVVVRVNDRGPFIGGRIIDLSRAAAEALDFVDAGETRVRVRYLGPAPVTQSSTAQQEGSPAPVARPDAPPRMRDVSFDVMVPPVGAPSPSSEADVAAAGFYVQLGAFSSISNAERLKSSLSANLPVKVEPVRVRNADFFRVLVGPWPTETRATTVKRDLASASYGDGIVVRSDR